MFFASLSEFITMGGHGIYVWSAYGISLFCLAFLFLSPLLKQRKLRQQIRQRANLESARKRGS